MFRDGFPFLDDDIVGSVIDVIPSETYRNVSLHTSSDEISYFLKQIKISFPYRLYSLEVDDAIFSKMDTTEKIILHCIYTRSCDGYVREKHVKALLTYDPPDWAIPYIVKVCDEYVVEILQVVYDSLKDKQTDKYKNFCAENRETFCKSYNRMISYWNEYYKDMFFNYKDYIGRKLFIEIFGAKRKMQSRVLVADLPDNRFVT